MTRRARITPKQFGKVVRLWNAGEAISAIGVATGLHDSQIYNAVRRARKMGLVDHRVRPHDAEQRQAAVDLYASGVPMREIVRATGYAPASVRHFAFEAGAKRPPSGERPNPFRGAAIEAVSRGWLATAVAEVVGVSRERVRQWCKAAGFPSSRAEKSARCGPQCPHCGGGLGGDALVVALADYDGRKAA